MNYQEGYELLQNIVDEMNSGELSIEEMVSKYEEGMKVYSELSEKLDAFEQRVSVLAEKNETEVEEIPYE